MAAPDGKTGLTCHWRGLVTNTCHHQPQQLTNWIQSPRRRDAIWSWSWPPASDVCWCSNWKQRVGS